MRDSRQPRCAMLLARTSQNVDNVLYDNALDLPTLACYVISMSILEIDRGLGCRTHHLGMTFSSDARLKWRVQRLRSMGFRC